MLTIIDYGVGNLSSIRNMLKKIGAPCRISTSISDVVGAEKLILPGVGAFDTCASKLRQSGLIDTLTQKVLHEHTPLLGVCVGMQLLMEKSEEGTLPGLGWIKGSNVRFKLEMGNQNLKVPHMGWTDVVLSKESRLFDEITEDPRFYFVHSYHPMLTNKEDELVSAHYGYTFTAGIERNNILGVQFHPEKSHRFGIRLLDNFVNKYYPNKLEGTQ
ncbi:MAG: imidazole glycerol phosphate synthase subunit HisH [Cyclobacteriaceae bacterium]